MKIKPSWNDYDEMSVLQQEVYSYIVEGVKEVERKNIEAMQKQEK